jgi:hypothetical protein
MENAWWCVKELLYYYVPESMLLDRAKRLWWNQYRDKRIENLEQMFNLEIDPIWEMR